MEGKTDGGKNSYIHDVDDDDDNLLELIERARQREEGQGASPKRLQYASSLPSTVTLMMILTLSMMVLTLWMMMYNIFRHSFSYLLTC